MSSWLISDSFGSDWELCWVLFGFIRTVLVSWTLESSRELFKSSWTLFDQSTMNQFVLTLRTRNLSPIVFIPSIDSQLKAFSCLIQQLSLDFQYKSITWPHPASQPFSLSLEQHPGTLLNTQLRNSLASLLAFVQIVKPEIGLTENGSLMALHISRLLVSYRTVENVESTPKAKCDIALWFPNRRLAVLHCFHSESRSKNSTWPMLNRLCANCGDLLSIFRRSPCWPSEHGAGCAPQLNQRHSQWHVRLRMLERRTQKGAAGESNSLYEWFISRERVARSTCVGRCARYTSANEMRSFA